jgi:hypothetical protein
MLHSIFYLAGALSIIWLVAWAVRVDKGLAPPSSFPFGLRDEEEIRRIHGDRAPF